jgi:hypothetical protein
VTRTLIVAAVWAASAAGGLAQQPDPTAPPPRPVTQPKTEAPPKTATPDLGAPRPVTPVPLPLPGVAAAPAAPARAAYPPPDLPPPGPFGYGALPPRIPFGPSVSPLEYPHYGFPPGAPYPQHTPLGAPQFGGRHWRR